MPITYPPRLCLAQIPTPLQPLERLSAVVGGPRIWVKRDDLTGSTLSGNKVRKLEFTIAQALTEGCDTLITCGGLQSNHCRTTALLGAQLGLKVHLLLRGEPEGVADGNLLLDHLCGATVSTYPRAEYESRLQYWLRHWREHYERQDRKAFIIPTGASDEIGVWGYVSAAEELATDFESHKISPKYIVCATGSGGTQAGLTVGSYLFGLGSRVIGMAVCDHEAYFHSKVCQDLTGWQRRYGVAVNLDKVATYVNDGYVGPGYAQATTEVFATIAQVARLEGLVLDPVYTGKALFGLISEIKSGKLADTDDIVFVHTGGVFGLFPQKQQLLAALEDREILDGSDNRFRCTGE